MHKLPVNSGALVTIVVLCGAALSAYAFLQGIPSAGVRFAALLAMAVVSARMKVRLRGLDSMAMNLPFIVTALVQLSLAKLALPMMYAYHSFRRYLNQAYAVERA